MSAISRKTLAFQVASRTHVGLTRELNEDSWLARPDTGIFAVADGMGGHKAGEVASGLIVECLGEIPRQPSGYALLNAVRDQLAAANWELTNRAAALGGGAVIGSTVVALAVHEDHYACVWAGDSRVYMQRGDLLMRLTHDHSLIQELIDTGQLDEREARKRRISNIITKAVGAAETLELSETRGDIRAGDLFLLCSDGLTGVVEDAEIRDVLGALSPEAAADRLLAMALERGGRDNITLMVLQAG
jgi:serine/threonine protein phosphatase PrpC